MKRPLPTIGHGGHDAEKLPCLPGRRLVARAAFPAGGGIRAMKHLKTRAEEGPAAVFGSRIRSVARRPAAHRRAFFHGGRFLPALLRDS